MTATSAFTTPAKALAAVPPPPATRRARERRSPGAALAPRSLRKQRAAAAASYPARAPMSRRARWVTACQRSHREGRDATSSLTCESRALPAKFQVPGQVSQSANRAVTARGARRGQEPVPRDVRPPSRDGPSRSTCGRWASRRRILPSKEDKVPRRGTRGGAPLDKKFTDSKERWKCSRFDFGPPTSNGAWNAGRRARRPRRRRRGRIPGSRPGRQSLRASSKFKPAAPPPF